MDPLLQAAVQAQLDRFPRSTLKMPYSRPNPPDGVCIHDIAHLNLFEQLAQLKHIGFPLKLPKRLPSLKT